MCFFSELELDGLEEWGEVYELRTALECGASGHLSVPSWR